jgi:DNA-binding beta-propeller fold protein YncE
MEYEAVLDVAATQEQALRPTAVSCDPATGEICVTDAQYSRFHVMNKHGVEVFRTGGFSSLSSPVDGSLTSNGDFVFIGRDENRTLTIRKLDFTGEPLSFSPEAPIDDWAPHHLTLALNEDILALDSYHNMLSRHDSETGALVWVTHIAGDGSEELQLGRPAQAPDGRIYVPSGMMHNVSVFSNDGRYLGDFGEFGSGPGKIVFPVGVAIGPDDSILVLDRMRHKVLMFDPEHNLMDEFGSMGAGRGQFYHPWAIAASPDGNVYVAQGYESRIQVFHIRDTKAE